MSNKYNLNFERDYNWYLSVIDVFNFDGTNEYLNKRGENIIQFDENGASAKESFFQYDTNGKILPTKEPEILHSILKAKGSVNLHIKMYAEDRANGTLSNAELIDLCHYLLAPKWFYDAVENQRVKYWKFKKHSKLI